ncbi:MAG: putative NAD/FAD-binding protein/Phytoene dehydrogenase-related protein [Pelagibacterales bacterium]|nr:putative NAD/FAD-binding protein/Phytoene dehydrogenase-related protein [Pelagibacterales bacterium]
MKIAVIGSGISGLSAAHFLSKKYKVDLYEKDNHFGGHSYTVDIPEKNSNKIIALDLGFIVFNKINYPNLLNFFNDLDVNYEKSNMSFAVSVKNSNIEYSGNGLNGLFANKSNIFNLKFLKMIKEIISFYKEAENLKVSNYKEETLGNFLKMRNFSDYFVDYHVIPMVAAIWSMPLSLAKKMPMDLFLNFFKNHGLFKIKNRPQWYTVTGRSKVYVKKVLQTVSGECFKNHEIKNVNRNKNGVTIYYGSSNEHIDYDQVIFATHADDTLKLIQNPTKNEKDILNSFKYKKNISYLHTDNQLMPNRENAWSSWNSIQEKNDLSKNCITYWLNKLQNLKTKNNYFLTLNPIFSINEDKIIKKVEFSHPFYDNETIKAQKKLPELQGVNNSWFCGSYFGYGFHEDGLKSSLDIIKKI